MREAAAGVDAEAAPRALVLPASWDDRAASALAALAPGGRFASADELRARIEEATATPGAGTVAYCGSGITAAIVVAAAEAAGMQGFRLYPGSWSE